MKKNIRKNTTYSDERASIAFFIMIVIFIVALIILEIVACEYYGHKSADEMLMEQAEKYASEQEAKYGTEERW